jgi:hypothetical protein
MLQMCEEKSRAQFGDKYQRTVWMFISIGSGYQRHTDWVEAGPWFKRALNEAMEKYDDDGGIRAALREAMEIKHSSYVNNECQLFSTIFRVGSLKTAQGVIATR